MELLQSMEGVIALPCDVQNTEQCERVVDEAAALLNGLDVLIFAAGMTQTATLQGTDRQDWQRLFDINVFGAASIARAAVPHLTDDASKGRALFLTSDTADRPYPGLVAYSASKAALGALCRGIQVEWPRLRVTEVKVGPTIGTDIARDDSPEELRQWITRWLNEGCYRFEAQEPGAVAELILGCATAEYPPASVIAAGPLRNGSP